MARDPGGHLAETEWVVESATVTEGSPYAVGAILNRVTNETRIMQLPLLAFSRPRVSGS